MNKNKKNRELFCDSAERAGVRMIEVNTDNLLILVDQA